MDEPPTKKARKDHVSESHAFSPGRSSVSRFHTIVYVLRQLQLLFNAGAPEKLIRGVTGHRSNALQLYQRPTTEQLQKTSVVLMHWEKYISPREGK